MATERTKRNIDIDNRDVPNSRDANQSRDANPDPITGAPGSHPVGTGVGAAAGGAAGAAIGSVIPGAGNVVGGVVGAVVGAVAGGFAGKGVAEAVDPTAEEAYWRDEHRNRPYFRSDYSYDDDYLPAYRYGYETRAAGGMWDDPDDEPNLRSGWERVKSKSRLEWEEAKQAMHDAWDRWDDADARRRRTPGDPGATGKSSSTGGTSIT